LNRHKVIGSNNWKKMQLAWARLHRKIANIRKDTLHKLTTLLAKNHGVIAIEDLNVSGMMANHKLAASVADMGFFEFLRQLTYKCELYGSKLVVVDKRISKVVQAPGFIRGINPKSIFENPQAPAFIRGVNLKSKI
jgi:putative transposase